MKCVERLGDYSIWKDGTWYRVHQGKKRIASFLLLWQASDHMQMRYSQDQG